MQQIFARGVQRRFEPRQTSVKILQRAPRPQGGDGGSRIRSRSQPPLTWKAKKTSVGACLWNPAAGEHSLIQIAPVPQSPCTQLIRQSSKDSSLNMTFNRETNQYLKKKPRPRFVSGRGPENATAARQHLLPKAHKHLCHPAGLKGAGFHQW